VHSVQEKNKEDGKELVDEKKKRQHLKINMAPLEGGIYDLHVIQNK